MTTRDVATVRSERQIRLAAELRHCDGQGLKRLTGAALTWLDTNHRVVNALNVFPVPDGDTGTNMLLTMQAAYKEIADSAENSVSKVAHAIAHGALMGARGNSGVILSQIWRGFARGLDNADAFDSGGLVAALRQGRETAYRGVVKPVEGTILTVIKDSAAAAEEASAHSQDLRYILDHVVQAAYVSVAHTPELLPVLKQAGVVDSGGKGLAIVMEGMLRYLRGQPLDEAVEVTVAPLNIAAVGAAMDAVEPGQEWEVIVDFRPRTPPDLPTLYGRLTNMGTSIQVGEGDGLYRVHIHLLKVKRHEPLELAEELGTIVKVHMENLLDQMEGIQGLAGDARLPLREVRPGQIGVVAVSPGQGFSRLMASLGAAAIIAGGQTMNPSTQDFLDAIGAVPTDHIIVLPNNDKIILAAQQAAEMSVKHVAVVPSCTVPQGLAALLKLLPDGDPDSVRAAMERGLGDLETGEVTLATRSVEIEGVAVKEGQVIGLHNGALKVAGEDVPKTVLRLLDAMRVEDRELITLYYGADITADQAGQMAEAIHASFPDHSVEVHDGGQPFYPYILSVE